MKIECWKHAKDRLTISIDMDSIDRDNSGVTRDLHKVNISRPIRSNGRYNVCIGTLIRSFD